MINNIKKIKLVVFIEGSFLPSYDGYSMGMSNQVRLLSDSNLFDVTVVHCYRGWSEIDLLKKEKYNIILVSPEIYYKDKNKFLQNELKKINPNFIQMQDSDLILSVGTKFKKVLGCKLIYNANFVVSTLIRSVVAKDSAEEVSKKETEAIRSSDVVFCLTEEDKKRLIILGAKEYRIKVIPVVLDIDWLLKIKRRPVNKRLIFLGNLFFGPNEEALRILLNCVFPEIYKKNNNIELIVVGDCPIFLKNEYSKLKGVKFTGKVKNLKKHFSEANLAVVPIIESTGIRSKLLFFFSAGVPCFCTNEAVEGMKNINKIAVVKGRNFSSWPDDILKLLRNEKKLRNMINNGRDYMSKNYSKKVLIKRFIGVYKNIVNLERSKYVSKFEFRNFTPPWLNEFKIKSKFKDIVPVIEVPAIIKNHKLTICHQISVKPEK